MKNAHRATQFLFRQLRSRPDAVLLTVMMVLVYGACAVVPYVFSDDYGQMLYISFKWTDWTTNGLSVDGRPLASFLICKGFALAGGLTHLFVLRMAAFVVGLWFAQYMRASLLRLGFNRRDAFIFTALTVLSPGMGELIGWTVSWPYPFVLLFVAWLSLRISENVENATPARLSVIFGACALALQIVLLTYQPVAGFLVVIPFLLLSRNRFRPLAFAAIALTFSFAIYRLAVYPSLHLLSPEMGTGSRAETTADLPGHLAYVAGNFLSFCGSSWGALVLPQNVATVFGWAIVLLAAIGVFSLCKRWRGWKAVAILLLALYALAISAPHVFVLDDIWAFRTHYPMMVLFSLAAWIGLSRLLKPTWNGWALGVVSILLCLSATWAVNVGIVYSASREYGLVKSALRELRDSGSTTACVLLAPDHPDAKAPLPLQSYSCYGQISIILMHIYEVGAVAAQDVWPDEEDRPTLVFVPADRPQDIPQGMMVVDLWGMITGRPSLMTVR